MNDLTKAAQARPARPRSARAKNLYLLGLAQVALMAIIGMNVVNKSAGDNNLASKASVHVASSQR